MEYQYLIRTIFSFGSSCNGQYGHLVLREDGSVYGYKNNNEYSWLLDKDSLLFRSSLGEVTSRFTLHHDTGVLLGHSVGQKWPLYLIPLLTNSKRNVDLTSVNEQSFLVNSIPKSGTYYLEAVLDEIGYPSERIHLGGSCNADDLRDVPDQQLPFNPLASRLHCPVELVTAILKGQHVVGHIEHRHIIDKIRALDVCVLTVVRNLRDVLTSLYYFKKNKVASLDSADAMWRKLTGSAGFYAFLAYYHDKDLLHIRLMAEMIINDTAKIQLRYEDNCQGVVSSNVKDSLEQLKPGLSFQFVNSLKKQYRQPTPTLSPSGVTCADLWDAIVDNYFVESGMDELNKALGY